MAISLPTLESVSPQAGDLLLRVLSEPPDYSDGWTLICDEPGKWMAYKTASPDDIASEDFIIRQSTFNRLREWSSLPNAQRTTETLISALSR